MFSLSGYTLEKIIHENKSFRIYRGHTMVERVPVIIKAPKNKASDAVASSKLMHEYKIVRYLDSQGIIKHLCLKSDAASLVLIMEDIGAISLKQYLEASKPDLSTFFNIAQQLVQTLEEIHRQEVVHTHLKPSNILIQPDKGIVKVIDFTSAKMFAGESRNIIKFPEGTPQYMAPEQTGRTRYDIDYRSDLYSLGIVFYELLTGQLPFNANNPRGWTHAHLTQIPQPPETINPEVPPAVSTVIMKLLAKKPKERYQKTSSLLVDITECRRQWLETGTINLFSPGHLDTSGHLHISSKFYGREKERETLKNALAMAKAGQFSLVLVTGPAGTGKTALVQETIKLIAADAGYFITGKFEQFRLNEPYAPFGQAFGHLMHQLLTENPDSLSMWKERIRRALGRSGTVITQIIPEIELIIGSQPPVEELQPMEAKNRFNLIFQDFVRVFARKEHPLVIFLDDLQWADPASMQLIQTLSEDPEGTHFLLIGAYRDDEIEGAHPLLTTLTKLDKKVPLKFIPLEPLTSTHTCQFIADSLSCTREKASLLAEILYLKTGGNPFYLRQLLEEVYDRKMVTYNTENNYWEWDYGSVHNLPATDDVVGLMLEKMNRFPEDTLNVLKLAAFIGNQFDMGTLAAAGGKTLPEIAAALQTLLSEGLILANVKPGQVKYTVGQPELVSSLELNELTTRFSFLHDRVQQVAYAMVPTEEERNMHLKIGRLLMHNTCQNEIDKKLFMILEHFDRSLYLLDNPAERIKLAGYNLMAGRKAKTGTAYESSLCYFKAGMSLLPDNAWDDFYELTHDLHLECFQCEYLVGNSHRAEQLFEVLLAKTKDKADIASLYSIKIRMYSSIGRYAEAPQVGIHALSSLGISFPAKAGKVSFIKEILLLKWRLRHKKVEELVNLPDMSDKFQKNILELLTVLAAALNAINPELYALTILKAGNLSVKYGNTDFSPIGYIGFSIVMGSGLGDYGTGHEFEKVAVKLSEKYHNSTARCIVNYVIGAYVSHWTQHGKTSLNYLNRAVQDGLDAGESLFVGFALGRNLETKCFLGEPLTELHQECLSNRTFCGRLKHTSLLIYTILFQRFASALMELTDDVSDLDQKVCDEDTLKKGNITILADFYLLQIQLAYLLGDYTKTLAIADKIQKLMDGHTKKGQINAADYYFYHSLSITASYADLLPKLKRKYLKILKKNQNRLKKWSSYCDANFLHKYLLIEAERARITGQHYKAIPLWDQAIQSAKENGYIQNEAIAGELAAKYYLAQGQHKIAYVYMRDSWNAYIRWGALAKARAMLECYPDLLTGLSMEELKHKSTGIMKEDLRNPPKGDSDYDSSTDLHTISQVLQTLSKESNPEKILKVFLTIAMENAGADRGFLIIEQGGELFIEASKESNFVPARILTHRPLEKSYSLSRSVVRYVARTLETVVINEIKKAGIFARDPYFSKCSAQSVVCLPILFQGIFTGVLYLENTLMSRVFIPERLDVLKLLSTQMAYVKKLETILDVDIPLSKDKLSLSVPLTERELEVLQLIATGMSNKEIAQRLTLTLSTIKTHILNIYGKLNVNRRVQAVTRAKELNLLNGTKLHMFLAQFLIEKHHIVHACTII